MKENPFKICKRYLINDPLLIVKIYRNTNNAIPAKSEQLWESPAADEATLNQSGSQVSAIRIKTSMQSNSCCDLPELLHTE